MGNQTKNINLSLLKTKNIKLKKEEEEEEKKNNHDRWHSKYGCRETSIK